MPRPITKKDLKELRRNYGHRRLRFKTDEDLGIIVRDNTTALDHYPWAYQCYRGNLGDGSNDSNAGLMLSWVTDKTLKRRKKLGHPKPRRKPARLFMRELDFQLDEMAQAEKIMEGLK